MPDLVITDIQLKVPPNGSVGMVPAVASVALNFGDAIYLQQDSSSPLGQSAALTDISAQASAIFGGLVVKAATQGNYAIIVQSGFIDLTATGLAAETYALSDTPGKLRPDTEIPGGSHLSIVGTSNAPPVFNISPYYVGVK